MNATGTHLPKRLPTTFSGLVNIMVPHAIMDIVDYGIVIDLLNRLALLPHPTEGQEQYLATLEALVEAYDREHADPLLDAKQSSPLDRLQYLVEQSGIGVTGLGEILGSKPAASMVLSGKRQLSKEHIRKLSAHFKISADYFL